MARETVFQPGVRIDAFLEECVGGWPLPSNLAGALRYAVLGGGKRIRPLLAWWCGVAGGAPGDASLAACAAVELVHAFSLVHDDLPAMDNDHTRRGRPTLHVHAGEAMAILAGDAMLALAFRVLVERGATATLAADLCRELARGATGMIAGQVHDTLGGMPQEWDPQRRLDEIHLGKTGGLILAACRMGAMCAAASRAPRPDDAAFLERITRYGQSVGLMFQIVDDLLDVEQTSEHAGKRTGKDAAAGKLTFPGVLGVARSRQEVGRLRESALAELSPLGPAAAGLRGLTEYLATRTR